MPGDAVALLTGCDEDAVGRLAPALSALDP
jgi:hypothetical protein